jgi:putative (di)nucleoside polyphosphate hydrolase
MVDKDGYRPNVGIIIVNKQKRAFWGRRFGESAWQFPQGGIGEDEDIEAAMFRELNEEVGLLPCHVSITARTSSWLYYEVPGAYVKSNYSYRGQKQIWYLLKFVGQDGHINVKKHHEPEFDAWRWIDYWQPIEEVVNFKQDVYRNALNELSEYL